MVESQQLEKLSPLESFSLEGKKMGIYVWFFVFQWGLNCSLSLFFFSSCWSLSSFFFASLQPLRISPVGSGRSPPPSQYLATGSGD